MKHGLNTDQDSEQGKEEQSEVMERGCKTYSGLWPAPCLIPGKSLLSCISVRRFDFFVACFFSNSLSPVLIRVQSVFHPWQKTVPRSDLPGLPNEPMKFADSNEFHVPETCASFLCVLSRLCGALVLDKKSGHHRDATKHRDFAVNSCVHGIRESQQI